MNRRVFVLSALALSGCATALPRVLPAPTVLGELEPLYRADAGRDGLTISVSSSGCTQKADFVFRLDRASGGRTLAFARTRLDACRSFARGRAELVFTWAELGATANEPLFLLNPLTAWTGP